VKKAPKIDGVFEVALKVQFDPLISKIIPFGPLIFFQIQFWIKTLFLLFSITGL
jgi:hypothetical protein